MNIHINGTDLHYLDVGRGEPLVLLHGGLLSTGDAWADHPASFTPHLARLARDYRVIAPDTRGHGRSRSGDGPITYERLAADVLALIDALGLESARIAGFSDGGVIAGVAALRAPGKVRALVLHACADTLDPRSHNLPMVRTVFGGRPDATQADPDATTRMFAHAPHDMLRRLQSDHGGDWRRVIREIFDRTTAPGDITVADLGRIRVPTLVVGGDADQLCGPDANRALHGALPDAELAIIPGLGHEISAAVIDAMLAFFTRRADRTDPRR